MLKDLVKATPLYEPLRNWSNRRREAREFVEWERRGKPAPPPHRAKQRTLLAYAQSFRLRTLVETGTYYGDMVEAMRGHFDRIVSIELSVPLHQEALRRFRGARTIELVQGDSGVALEGVVRGLGGPALFWLDGHYSAGETAKGERDTPIFEELRHVLDSPEQNHIIVVDDARLFGTDPSYPTLEELSRFVRSKRPSLTIEVEEDSIRITPKPRPEPAGPTRRN